MEIIRIYCILRYGSQWYVAPPHAQKLLLLMMQRGIKGAFISVGGIFIASLEGFATVINHCPDLRCDSKVQLLCSFRSIISLSRVSDHQYVVFVFYGNTFRSIITLANYIYSFILAPTKTYLERL